MQELKSKDIEGRYINRDKDRTILATWESPTLLVLDFHNTADVDCDSPNFDDSCLGTLKVRVK